MILSQFSAWFPVYGHIWSFPASPSCLTLTLVNPCCCSLVNQGPQHKNPLPSVFPCQIILHYVEVTHCSPWLLSCHASCCLPCLVHLCSCRLVHGLSAVFSSVLVSAKSPCLVFLYVLLCLYLCSCPLLPVFHLVLFGSLARHLLFTLLYLIYLSME